MKKHIPILLALTLSLAFSSTLSAQQVQNVDFSQLGPEIHVSYDLLGEAQAADYTISLHYSANGGATFTGPLRALSGDVGPVKPGTGKRIIWRMTEEVPQILSDAVVMRVQAEVKPRFTFPIPEMVRVEGGTFQMGSNEGGADEKPVHPVKLSSFEIGKHEVTQKEWKAVMGSNPSSFPCDDCPVENVSWENVQSFIEKLNRLTGSNYRLPTEAEWEYAARGGNKSRGYSYAGSNELSAFGWYSSNSGSKTHPVGQKQANELGLYDMSGNVWEWCADGYDAGYYASCQRQGTVLNPQGPGGTSSMRVLRGGGWYSLPAYCRVARRLRNAPDYRFFYIGFRLARSL